MDLISWTYNETNWTINTRNLNFNSNNVLLGMTGTVFARISEVKYIGPVTDSEELNNRQKNQCLWYNRYNSGNGESNFWKYYGKGQEVCTTTYLDEGK